MNHPVKKLEFLDRIRRSYEKWEKYISNVDREKMHDSGFCGKWSMKDVIAHIAWYENEMTVLLGQKKFAGSEYWNLSLKERNEKIFQENKDKNIEEVLRNAKDVHERFMELLAKTSEKALNDPGCFPGMPAEWRPWEVIAGNSYEHYDYHLPIKLSDGEED